MFVTARKLTKFLKPLAEATRDGVDLTVTLDERGNLSWAAQRIKGLLQSFHAALIKIAGTAILLSQQAPELARLSRLMEERSQGQQRSAEGIAEASRTLADTVSSITQSAGEAAAFSRQVADATRSANDNDQQSRQQIQAIGDSTRALEQQMNLLKDSSASISEVVELIKNIADRTRLLSLNAAIEAARAGEQGRGFGVVADEVRKLADQTMDATQNVETLLAAIQQQVASSSQTMADMSEQVSAGIAVSQAAGESIETASRDIGTLIEHVHAIAEASNEQNDKVLAIANQIGNVVENSQQQLADARELAERAGQVSEKCDELLTEVGEFRFEGHRRMRERVQDAISQWKLDRLDPDDLDRKLVELYRSESSFEMLCITDSRGRQISSDVESGQVHSGGRKNNWGDRRWFQEPARKLRLYVSDLYRSVDTNQYCFTIGTPLFDTRGQLLGVMSADVRFNHIVES
ncbi:methyl-accepting chemotaxis protein [Chromobacterium sp. IIBBL 290-4]|uniref:methyl-accepting chemotaxis protein n=1 Tax=Chromobacterium sp. IIBBL 290-4 TaxID=2953890 RepID=UPI0020B78830|nr:methyl-accepting chemotaxis protein [Chromobacterium sp. IIBBL 290-4]UTH73185.1 methyl-accepting chemotaxis protein [Chromobacterium sp. IIBBL 290-4]